MSKYFLVSELDEGDLCYPKSMIRDQITKDGIDAVEVWKAKPLYGSDMFFCTKYREVGITGESDCGKSCESYKPRNGKNGRCIHSSHCYEPDKSKTYTIRQ